MDDAEYMTRALRLARRGEGYVEPNPTVGCVIVKRGRIVGEGWHRRFGGPHAEIEALRRAGPRARGAAVYVTLEPCCHHGKTPPCTEALIEAGVGRVVIGFVEPTPQREGRGIEALEAAGVDVELGPMGAEAARILEPFIKRQLTALPYVIAKWAATVDGAIATHTGHSRWISNESSRRLVHRTRARVDAIVIGIGTALADDPSLTARRVKVRRTARRVVIDPHLKLPAEGKLLRTLDRAPLTVAASQAALRSRKPSKPKELADAGVEVIGLPNRSGRDANQLDLRPLLSGLVKDHGATNVLVEGGARTLGAFIEQGLVDELMVFIAPKLLGDPDALRPALTHAAPESLSRIDRARPLRLISTRRLGGDVLLSYRLSG